MIDDFIIKVAKAYCKCDECNGVGVLYTIKNGACGKITRSKKGYTTNNILLDFLKLGLIKKVTGGYYITNGNKKLSWANISAITDKEHRKAFWVFRKGIVDSLVSSLIPIDGSVSAYSVGSGKITSDYDITLYGDQSRIFTLMKRFENKIKQVFNETSSVLFDTNIYGRGFIQYTSGASLVRADCNGINFYYTRYSDACNESQFIWGLLHCYKTFVSIYGVHVVDLLEKELDNKYFSYASELYSYLENQYLDYIKVLGKGDRLLPNYLYNDKVIKNIDAISLSNYYANEAYYTYGAFVDVVVNTQMCKPKTGESPTVWNTPIEISIHVFTQSILDNLAFYTLHPNEKYANRIKRRFEFYTYDNLEYPVSEVFDEYLDQVVDCRRAALQLFKQIVKEYSDIVAFDDDDIPPIMKLVKSGKIL